MLIFIKSSTGLLSHDPPIVAHGLCLSSAGKKDTLVNIEAKKQWVFNLLSESWIHQANACAEACDPDVMSLRLLAYLLFRVNKFQYPVSKKQWLH